MLEDILKFFDFMPKEYKSFLIPFAVVFPLVYSCLFICAISFATFPVFERVIFTIAACVIQLALANWLFSFIEEKETSLLLAGYTLEYRLAAPDSRNSFCITLIAINSCLIFFYRFVYLPLYNQICGTNRVVNFRYYIVSFAFCIFFFFLFVSITKSKSWNKKHKKRTES